MLKQNLQKQEKRSPHIASREVLSSLLNSDNGGCLTSKRESNSASAPQTFKMALFRNLFTLLTTGDQSFARKFLAAKKVKFYTGVELWESSPRQGVKFHSGVELNFLAAAWLTGNMFSEKFEGPNLESHFFLFCFIPCGPLPWQRVNRLLCTLFLRV